MATAMAHDDTIGELDTPGGMGDVGDDGGATDAELASVGVDTSALVSPEDRAAATRAYNDTVNAAAAANRGNTIDALSGGGAIATTAALALVPAVGEAAVAIAAIGAFWAGSLQAVKWLGKTFGFARAGGGRCETPPRDENDPAWQHYDWSQYIGTPFERFAVPVLERNWELFNNCRELGPMTQDKLVVRLVEIWNALHDGPSERHEFTGGFHDNTPWHPIRDAKIGGGAYDLNVGPMKSAPRQVGRLNRLGLKGGGVMPAPLTMRRLSPSAAAASFEASAPRAAGMSTAEKVAIGGGVLALAGLAWSFWKGWLVL